MTRLGLEQKEKVPIFLSLFVIREEALLEIGSVFEMVCHFILLVKKLAIGQFTNKVFHHYKPLPMPFGFG